MIKPFKACALTFVLAAVVYPAFVWGVAQLLFPSQADGSLIYGSDGRTVIGSELIAQRFASARYFHPRPSAVDYKAEAGGASNLGTNNPDLHEAVAARVAAVGATATEPAPADLVMASGSGLDPDISLVAAIFQAPRVAKARGMSIESVRAVIERMTNRSGEMIGASARVNVLLLNLELDR